LVEVGVYRLLITIGVVASPEAAIVAELPKDTRMAT
jgi:hypothetical protein